VGNPIAGLYGLLASAARDHPSAVALIDPVGRRTLTYGDLDALARARARQLADAGIREGDRVALVLDKSFEAVAWIYGILAAGAAYVPIDPHAPAARIEHVLADSGACGVVRDDGSGVKWSPRVPSGEPVPGAAYLLYTSGSTGLPKAAVHTHASALAFLDAFSQLLAPQASDCFSCHPPYHFDMSTLDLFLSVRHGARAVLLAQDTGRLAPALAQIIVDHQITIWWSVPTALRLLLQFGRLERRSGWALRHVLFAGEPLSPGDARKLQQHWSGARLYNVYGCTETNNTTSFELPSPVPADRGDAFPIGTAVAGVATAVVDRELRDVSPGSEGELLVAGASLMTGYWTDPARTAAALVVRDGVTWYRTGDLVRRDAHGDLVLLGRADRMVKRRGYRIELAELERCLALHPELAEVAVVADKRAPEVMIHAYFVARASATAANELTGFLTERLPAYMLPDTFTALTELPKTSTGKTDYQELLARRVTVT
jgi:amino acid adenylation domain-containing protein